MGVYLVELGLLVQPGMNYLEGYSVLCREKDQNPGKRHSELESHTSHITYNDFVDLIMKKNIYLMLLIDR